MEKTTEEKARAKLLKFGKKNRWNRAVAVSLLFFVMLFFRVCNYCKNNGKRFVVMAGTFFLFAVYSSFSFPAFITEDAGNDYELKNAETADISLAEEKEPDMAGLELLEDEDVLEQSDYNSISHGYALVDKYDASDILRASEEIVSENGRETGTGSDARETTEQQEFRSDDWRLVLINKQNSIPEDYTFQLGTIRGSMQCDKRILEDLLAMLEAAEEDGVNLTICSPYRDLEYQQMLFNRKIKRYMNRGMSYMEAYQLSSQAVTVPGASEHQIGLALDIVCNSYMSLDEGFGDTKAGKWLAANSCRFGFILRYPKGKEDITGIEYEPWHFRYVGAPHAQLMEQNGLCLEEYSIFLREMGPQQCRLAGGRVAQVLYVPCESGQARLPDGCVQVSGDNAGGFIATVWQAAAWGCGA